MSIDTVLVLYNFSSSLGTYYKHNNYNKTRTKTKAIYSISI